jgi:ATP-binding cassette subfamily E protein 1
MSGKLTRIAIIREERCKPKKCKQECKRSCPVVRLGKECIGVSPTSKIAYISESLCIGCGICVKKCPFDAINIINIPKSLDKEQTHRYGPNSFKLHRLPMPRPGQVLGVVGTNGIGKSTALKILGGKQKPNLGRFENPPDWAEILVYFRGSELQNYFTRILEDNLKALIKPQYVDHIPRAVKGKVIDIMNAKNQRDNVEWAMTELDLNHVKDRNVDVLSGGELQRFAIAAVVVQQADVYMFDEPSSYLDVKQRLKAATTIRAIVAAGQVDDAGIHRYCLVVEHDLAILDYVADYICVLYGTPSAYGVVTMPFSVREGINIFLQGFVPTENLRFREEELNFKLTTNTELFDNPGKISMYNYPAMTKTMTGAEVPGTPIQTFKLHVEAGQFTDTEIVVMLGENGTGKTTFIRMMAGLLKSDEAVEAEAEGDMYLASQFTPPVLNVSYKPQKISPKFMGTVRALLHKKIRDAYVHPQFISDVMRPMSIDPIFDNGIQTLSGGELQRVAITLCLGTAADIYLIDEPSAYLDSEQRIATSKVINGRYFAPTNTPIYQFTNTYIPIYLYTNI